MRENANRRYVRFCDLKQSGLDTVAGSVATSQSLPGRMRRLPNRRVCVWPHADGSVSVRFKALVEGSGRFAMGRISVLEFSLSADGAKCLELLLFEATTGRTSL